MKKYSILLSFLILVTSCDQRSRCSGITNNRYSGNAVIFYYLPISGSALELMIMPVCNDSMAFRRDALLDFGGIKLMKGIGVTVGSIRDSSFREVLLSPQRIELKNNSELAVEYHKIYACPVYIEFEEFGNVTRSVTGNNNYIKERLVLENAHELNLEFFLVNSLKVSSIRKL